MSIRTLHLSHYLVGSKQTRIMLFPWTQSEVGIWNAQLVVKKLSFSPTKGPRLQPASAEMVAEEVMKSELELAGIFDSIVQGWQQIDIINAGAAFYQEMPAPIAWSRVGGGSVMIPPRRSISYWRGKWWFSALADQAGTMEGAKQLPRT